MTPMFIPYACAIAVASAISEWKVCNYERAHREYLSIPASFGGRDTLILARAFRPIGRGVRGGLWKAASCHEQVCG